MIQVAVGNEDRVNLGFFVIELVDAVQLWQDSELLQAFCALR